jgi:hypothetical protein
VAARAVAQEKGPLVLVGLQLTQLTALPSHNPPHMTLISISKG